MVDRRRVGMVLALVLVALILGLWLAGRVLDSSGEAPNGTGLTYRGEF
jgi:hypothetical protein